MKTGSLLYDKTYLAFLAGVALIAVVTLAASEMAYQDAVNSDTHYTAMVCGGFWPDYRKWEPECPDQTSTPDTLSPVELVGAL